jgi:hypothetical protein
MCTPSLARFFEHPCPCCGLSKALTGLLLNCVCGWRRGAEPFLSVEVSPLFGCWAGTTEVSKACGLLREPVQGRRSFACASNAGPVREILRRKLTNLIQSRTLQ